MNNLHKANGVCLLTYSYLVTHSAHVLQTQAATECSVSLSAVPLEKIGGLLTGRKQSPVIAVDQTSKPSVTGCHLLNSINNILQILISSSLNSVSY